MEDGNQRKAELLAAVDERLSRFADDGDAVAVLDPEALALASELAGHGEDLEVAYTLGLLHHYRLVAAAAKHTQGIDTARIDA